MRKKLGDVFEDSFTLTGTLEYQQYHNSIPLAMCWIYTKTQNCYIGRQGKQDYLLYATDNHDSRYALLLGNVDLMDLRFKAATANAEVHILGTYYEAIIEEKS